MGTELDMVYVTKVSDDKLAAQSVGVHGDHGFEGTYVASAGPGGADRGDERLTRTATAGGRIPDPSAVRPESRRER
ncbi:hypothetical protein AB0D04_04320 [Streptomyces sp. NPDC048483]|uniref:hypothetical protein n=1 Tax=Streptomyces sp. NPDC048483 TaxID=3154927 RepID=UPI00341B62B0